MAEQGSATEFWVHCGLCGHEWIGFHLPKLPEVEAMKKCRVCECTDCDGCANPDYDGGCTWVLPDLCSTCADFLEVMAAYMMVAGPHDRHTLEHATVAVRRCLAEVARANLPQDEQPPEPLIVLAKP